MPIISDFITGSGSSNAIPVGSVHDVCILPASEKVYILWNDPFNITVGESVVAEWGGTKLRYQAGSMPENRFSGELVVDNIIRDYYTENYLCKSGLTNGQPYYFKFFPYTVDKTYTDSTDNEFVVTPTAQVDGINNWCVKNIKVTSGIGNGKITVSWEDPSETLWKYVNRSFYDDNGNCIDNLITAAIPLATWGSTTIVVKAGSYATSDFDIDDVDIVFVDTVTTRNKYKTSPLTISGLTNGTKYYISFFPETTDGGICTNTSQRTTGTANRITISTVPSQSGTLTYNGNAQIPSWSNYDTSKMTISVTPQTNAGTYTATFTPKSDYRWSDGTTTAKSVEWTIDKADGWFSVDPSDINLDPDYPYATFDVSRVGDGAVVVRSEDTSIAVVSPDIYQEAGLATFTVFSPNESTGKTNIVVSVDDGTNYRYPGEKTCSVNASFVPVASTTGTTGVTYETGISDLDAATISLFSKAISNNGLITRSTSNVYINFGSVRRKISIGDIAVVPISGVPCTFRIIGFNHDTLSEKNAYGEETTTGKAGITLEICDLVADTRCPMNDTATNVGGWKESVMRTSTMTTIENNISQEWQSVIVAVEKTAGIGGTSSEVETVTDRCFLFSEIELYGSIKIITGSAKASCEGEGYQYNYYLAGNSTVKQIYSNGSYDTSDYWTRSSYPHNSVAFCNARTTNKDRHVASATITKGVSFAFCV